MIWEQKRTVHRGQEYSQSIMFQRVISTITLQPYCTFYFFHHSVLMEKHHECWGDVAQTCLCGWDCLLRSFISVLPFSEIMLRTYWRVMLWRTTAWNDSQWWELKKAKSCSYIHLACPGRHIDIGLEARKLKNCIAKLTEIALSLFSIFTVYNICKVIYIVISVDIFLHFFNSVYFDNTDWKSIPCRKHCQ